MEFDVTLLIVMGIFALCYLVLRTFLFGPLYAMLRERESEVAAARAIWRETKGETEAEIEAQRARLAQARLEARSRRDELRREAQARRQEVLTAAKRDAEAKLARAQAELDATVAEEREKLQIQAAQLAETMTRRVLGRAS